jgi:hypothetical protein
MARAALVLTSRERARLLLFEVEIRGPGRRTILLELDVRKHE